MEIGQRKKPNCDRVRFQLQDNAVFLWFQVNKVDD